MTKFRHHHRWEIEGDYEGTEEVSVTYRCAGCKKSIVVDFKKASEVLRETFKQ